MRPKNLAALIGRPSTFDLELATEVLRRLAAGEALSRIAETPGMPAPSTMRSWANNRPWLGEALEEALQNRADRLFDEIVPLADGLADRPTAPQVFKVQTQIKARQLVASKLAPDRYGERSVVAAGVHTEVRIYLPAKQASLAGGDALVIDGQARQLEDASEDGAES